MAADVGGRSATYGRAMNAGIATSTAPDRVQAEPDAFTPPFRSVVCGIDGSRSAHEAAHQAAELVAPGGLLELVAVADEWGTGLNASAVLSHSHARRALDEIAGELRGCGARVVTRELSGRPPWQLLLEQSAGHDLLVVARHSRSRFGGMAIGRTATNVAHRAHVPVLIASPPPDGVPFPHRILVAADGPGHPERAVELAGKIARQNGAEVTLLRLDWSRRARRREISAAIAELAAKVEPVEILLGGTPHRRIPEIARKERAALLVVGSRGLTGPRALSSTSERVAHEAPCSVLIVRPPTPAPANAA
jgi:nucleotide-binding universal stress UspA family protein